MPVYCVDLEGVNWSPLPETKHISSSVKREIAAALYFMQLRAGGGDIYLIHGGGGGGGNMKYEAYFDDSSPLSQYEV